MDPGFGGGGGGGGREKFPRFYWCGENVIKKPRMGIFDKYRPPPRLELLMVDLETSVQNTLPSKIGTFYGGVRNFGPEYLPSPT